MTLYMYAEFAADQTDHFADALGWNKVKYARITIKHVCLIATTLAGPLGRCLSTRFVGLVFKHLPRDPVNVNA